MPPTRNSGPGSRFTFWEQEEPGIRVLYQVVRHALGATGPVRIHGLELSRARDVIILRVVNLRDRPLRQFVEVPFVPEVLRRVAAALEGFAAQAEAETHALRQRLGTAEQDRSRSDGEASPLASQPAGTPASGRRRHRQARTLAGEGAP